MADGRLPAAGNAPPVASTPVAEWPHLGSVGSGPALLAAVTAFAEAEIAHRVVDYDRDERFPEDLLAQMGSVGFFGGTVPVRYGGLGLDYPTFAAFLEELSRIDHSIATLVSMPSGLVGASLLRYGTEHQRQRWLVPLAQGKTFGAAAITEPDAGSDVAGLTTRYLSEDGDFVLTGAKAWISNLDIASFFIIFATSDPALRHRGISAFIVPRDTPGLVLRPQADKLGFRPITVGDILLDEVRVPREALLGEEHDGFAVAMVAVESGRLGVAARSLGLAQACLDDAVAFAGRRKAFGRTVAEFQIVQSKITDMRVGITTARLLVQACAAEIEAGRGSRQLTSMTKMYASDVAARSAADAVQILGSAGVSGAERVGRFYRDAKVMQIVEGSNDLHRALIAEFELGLRNSTPNQGDREDGAPRS